LGRFFRTEYGVKIDFNSMNRGAAMAAGFAAPQSKALKVSKAKGVTPAVPSED
jgi:hypothetical protein